MKTLICAYELNFTNEILNDIILSLQKKRKKFFQVGSSLFERNNFFGFLVIVEKQFWLIYYGQPNSNFHCETEMARTKLKSFIPNLEIEAAEFENPEGEKKVILKKSLSGLIQFLKKKTKINAKIHPVCGDNNLAEDCWLAAIHKKEKPELPWLNQAALRALKSELNPLIEEQVNLKVSAILSQPNHLEQNQKVSVDPFSYFLKITETKNFASELFTKLKGDLDDHISKVEARLSQVEPRLSQVEPRLSQVEPRLSQVEPRLSQVEARLSQVECTISSMRPDVLQNSKEVRDLRKKLEERLSKVEDTLSNTLPECIQNSNEAIYATEQVENAIRRLRPEVLQNSKGVRDLRKKLEERLSKVEDTLSNTLPECIVNSNEAIYATEQVEDAIRKLEERLSKVEDTLTHDTMSSVAAYNDLASKFNSFLDNDFKPLDSYCDRIANLVNKTAEELEFLQNWTMQLSWRFLKFTEWAGWRASTPRNRTEEEASKRKTVDASRLLISAQ